MRRKDAAEMYGVACHRCRDRGLEAIKNGSKSTNHVISNEGGICGDCVLELVEDTYARTAADAQVQEK